MGNYWIAVGDQTNWERGVEQGIWGLIPHHEKMWSKMLEGDIVLFHCTSPVARIFGAGIVTGTFRQDRPLWIEEVQRNEVIWPYRFSFRIIHLLPLVNWKAHGVSPRKYSLPVNAGINRVAEPKNAQKTVDELKKNLQALEALPFEITGKVNELQVDKPYGEKTLHTEIQERLVDIGNMQRYLAEKEVPFEYGRLDVTWKRQLRSVPTYVFEVQVSGNIQSAIGKLKSAHDMWNSKIILVTEAKQHETARQLSSGIFWEVSGALKILTIENIKDLHDAKKNFYDMEQRFGLM